MGIILLIIILLCISTGTFAIGTISGSKLGSSYKSSVALKATFVFVITGLVALSLGFIIGKLLYDVEGHVSVWLAFAMFFLIGVRLLMESIEKSPSLNYTDIVQSSYLIKVAVQASVDVFMIGFILALESHRMFLIALFFSALFTFISTALGLSHGHSFTKTVLGNRLQLVAGIIMIIIAVWYVIRYN